MGQVVTGVVEAVKSTKTEGQHGQFFRIGMKIGEQWFNMNSNNAQVVNKGDNVNLIYETTASGFHNVVKQGLKVLNKGEPKGVTETATGVAKAATKTFVDNTLGMIKGNTVTNAVTLATHNAASSEVTLQDLKDAAELVLALHGYLESLDIKTKLAQTKVPNAKTKAVLKDANEGKIIKARNARAVLEDALDDEEEDPFV